jgi:ribosome biogenesis GTPase
VKTGIVVKTTGSWHTVKAGSERIQCRLKGNFRMRNMKNTNPVAVGDQVTIESPDNNTGIIVKISDRKNYIIRKSTNLSRESQILAANIDQVLLMITLDFPETPLEFVDRFLHLNWMAEVIRMYEFAGYSVVTLSVTKEINLDKVLELMKNKLTLIAGNSGVGKSSLINFYSPGLNLKINDISWYHQSGKHTTTYPEMIEIRDNTYIIDSPGIRGFGLTDIHRNEIGLYFTDIFKLSKNCQFYNCTHTHEPHCAVIEAYRTGVLHESRYRSYYNIFNDTDQKYRIG